MQKIQKHDADNLEVMPLELEVKGAVWSCDLSKAPESDCFNLNFIRKIWDIVGADFTSAILNLFKIGSIEKVLNMSWVTLILKYDGAMEMKDLRPISTVGCIYKVISKILTRRIRRVMNDLVGEAQTAFLQDRKIYDGALIACESVHWLKKAKKKLDFRKAYDSIRWSFVDYVLEKIGFGCTWRKWVMSCIFSASMSIFINGFLTKSFNMEKMLKQGDLLSPFLFILAAEVLNKVIFKVVNKGLIQGSEIGKDKVRLTHLQFANDTILFCSAKNKCLANYKSILDCFSLMTGQFINFEKLAIIPLNYLKHKVCKLKTGSIVLLLSYLLDILGSS